MMNDDHNYNYNDNQNFQITMNSQLLQISKQKGSKFELIPFATKAWTLMSQAIDRLNIKLDSNGVISETQNMLFVIVVLKFLLSPPN